MKPHLGGDRMLAACELGDAEKTTVLEYYDETWARRGLAVLQHGGTF
jgi:hypothetical protein